MDNIRLIYEQLEAARNHLRRSTLLDYRLALILADNVAELLMYRELDYRFRFDDSLMPRSHPLYPEYTKKGLGPKYTLEERQAAEREFEPKLRLLVRLKQIPTEDRLVLGICHRFRGSAFHRGELRHDIVAHVSKLLYVTTVRLALKLRPQSYTLNNPPAPDADRFAVRMKEHQRNATRAALPDAPNEFYSWWHGQGEVIDLRVVPDRVAALLLEAEATCALTAAGHEVFGHWPGALCPARAWLGDTPWWPRNWCGRRVADGAVQLLYSLREFLRVAWSGGFRRETAASGTAVHV
jgi:hypothetical protein